MPSRARPFGLPPHLRTGAGVMQASDPGPHAGGGGEGPGGPAAVTPASAGTFADAVGAFDAADALVADLIVACRAMHGRPVAVGLAGAQGSGKSTMAARLRVLLEMRGLRAAVLSLDDFYLTRAERAALCRDVHPLLATRGVPGTHDVALACRTIEALLSGSGPVASPRFDKTTDDRAPPHDGSMHGTPADVVVLEGWCVGARPLPEHRLETPVNALEQDEDADGSWRRHVNAALRRDYRRLFRRLRLIVLLRAPGFEAVHGWRMQQERGLGWSPGQGAGMMDEATLRRFIAHYERLTRWMLEDEPADLVLDIAADRRPVRWRPGRRDVRST